MFIAFASRTVGHLWYGLIRGVDGLMMINNGNKFLITGCGSFIVEVISFCAGSACNWIFSTNV